MMTMMTVMMKNVDVDADNGDDEYIGGIGA